jgi:hypothetical protein
MHFVGKVTDDGTAFATVFLQQDPSDFFLHLK